MRITELCELVREAIENNSTTIEFYPWQLAEALKNIGFNAYPKEDWVVLYHMDSGSYTYGLRAEISNEIWMQCYEYDGFATQEKAQEICQMLNKSAQ